MHQVNDIIQLQQVPDLVAAVHQRDEPRADLRGHRVDRIADDVVQQLVGVPRLAAALQPCSNSSGLHAYSKGSELHMMAQDMSWARQCQ